MAAKKGHIKEGGRVKGTPNKATTDIKQAFKKLIEDNLDNMTLWLEKVALRDPEKAIRIINDLSEYIIPKLARTDLTSGDKPIDFRPDTSKLNKVDKQKLIELANKIDNGK